MLMNAPKLCAFAKRRQWRPSPLPLHRIKYETEWWQIAQENASTRRNVIERNEIHDEKILKNIEVASDREIEIHTSRQTLAFKGINPHCSLSRTRRVCVLAYQRKKPSTEHERWMCNIVCGQPDEHEQLQYSKQHANAHKKNVTMPMTTTTATAMTMMIMTMLLLPPPTPPPLSLLMKQINRTNVVKHPAARHNLFAQQ